MVSRPKTRFTRECYLALVEDPAATCKLMFLFKPHQHMYNHVATLGACVEPYLSVPVQSCSVDNDCRCVYLRRFIPSTLKKHTSDSLFSQYHTYSILSDGNSCTTDVCIAGSCTNTMQNNCCGNLVCEGERTCDISHLN